MQRPLDAPTVRSKVERLLADAAGKAAGIMRDVAVQRDERARITQGTWSNRHGTLMAHASWLPGGDVAADAIEMVFEISGDESETRVNGELCRSDGTILAELHASSTGSLDPVRVADWIANQLLLLGDTIKAQLPTLLIKVELELDKEP